ncbi:MAG: hypothetical protein AAGF91_11965 [Actinomycetota bacterium]
MTTTIHPSPETGATSLDEIETVASATASDRTPLMISALVALIVGHLLQLAAGFAQVEPFPPGDVLPMIGATVALGAAAIPLVRAGQRAGLMLGIAFCALSLIGMGPHKLFLENGSVIAPIALMGFAFEIVFVRAAILELRRR